MCIRDRGYYTEQIAADAVTLQEEFGGNTPNELANFFLAEGPIARQGMPAITQSEAGAAAVALDLSSYPTAGRDGAEFHLAVARVATDMPGTFVSDLDDELTGEDWIVAYDRVATGDVELPAVAISADGTLDVELFEVTVTEVGVEGFSGQLGGQGRPQVFLFTEEAAQYDVRVVGARVTPIRQFAGEGIVLDGSSSDLLFNPFLGVVSGDPGLTFDIIVDAPAPEPEAEPEPETEPDREPEPGPGTATDLGDARANEFADFLAVDGFEFANTQAGGFFDGCNGPDDPDVTSYLFDDPNDQLVVFTPYPSAARAQSAFDALFSVASPCPAFETLQVLSIEALPDNEVLIEWQFEGDTGSTNFEQYRLVGDTIVVATSASAIGAEAEMARLRPFTG